MTHRCSSYDNTLRIFGKVVGVFEGLKSPDSINIQYHSLFYGETSNTSIHIHLIFSFILVYTTLWSKYSNDDILQHFFQRVGHSLQWNWRFLSLFNRFVCFSLHFSREMCMVHFGTSDGSTLIQITLFYFQNAPSINRHTKLSYLLTGDCKVDFEIARRPYTNHFRFYFCPMTYRCGNRTVIHNTDNTVSPYYQFTNIKQTFEEQQQKKYNAYGIHSVFRREKCV